eukprot:Nitzschia sp. Nitz4//scaffold155_size52807//9535//9901//NITZ4_006792-RA/size52807-augustus-gene-0.46-mRNA-1//1//CDS//3329537357//3866//frame0
MADNNSSSSTPESSGNDLTDCLLSQYRFCAAGVGLGTAYALRFKKGVMPMIAAGAVGTSVDMVYGYLVECAQFRDGETTTPSQSSSSSTTK